MMTLVEIDNRRLYIQVTPSHRRNFRLTSDAVLGCLRCGRVKGPSTNSERLVRAFPNDATSILIPTTLSRPHECLLSTLKTIDHHYRLGLIPTKLFDEWMSANGTTYQMGNSKACMRLWDEAKQLPVKRVHSDHCNNIMVPANSAVSLVQCKYHSGTYVKISWSRLKRKEDIKCLDEVWKWSSAADQAKTNVSAADLIWHMSSRSWCRSLFDQWSRYFNTNLYNVTVSAMLIHLTGNPSGITVFKYLESNRFCCISVDNYKDIFKTFSVALRRTGHWPDGKKASLDEVTQCAGWELAVGRSMNRSDWVDEQRKRTEAVIPLGSPLIREKTDKTNQEYCVRLKHHLEQIMSELVDRSKRCVSWTEYVEDRQSWCSSGSTGGKKLKLDDSKAIRLNKHAYFETLTKEEMVAWLDQEPCIVATASEKFEMGKARAIYGTQTEDYSIAAYVLDGIEAKLYNVDGVESGLVGHDFIATMIRRCSAVERAGTECTMIDYADFNYQHTLLAQSLVFSTLAEVLGKRGYHSDKVRASLWISNALMNQWCKFPNKGATKLRVTQGMFSGCRGTNFINTLLNVAYFRQAREWTEQQYGLQPIDLHNVHQGDDVWISNKSRLWAMVIFEVMQATGFVFQSAKQMFDVCRGEFLRVVYTQDGCQGYLGRSVGTLIMKPIQGTDVNSPSERAVAVNSQIMILKRRGLTDRGCELVWDAIVPYAARSKLPSGAITIPVSYLNKSYLDGGLDLGYPGTAARPSNTVSSIPVMELGSKVLEEAVPSNMARDWANILSRSIKSSIKYDDLVEALHQANITDSLRSEDRTLSLRKMERRLRTWMGDSDFGTVCRTRGAYDELKIGDTADVTFKRELKELCSNLFRKRTKFKPSLIDTLMRALGTSPFKSVSNAMICTGLKVLPAAEVAILSNADKRIAARGIEVLTTLRTKCGDEVARAALDGWRAGATAFEAEIHPVILSWIQNKSLEATMKTIIAEKMQSGRQVEELIAHDFQRYVRAVIEDGRLVQISKY
nr:MAG: RNA-dependent RNA polymerase [Aedes japonicus totivirus 1]